MLNNLVVQHFPLPQSRYNLSESEGFILETCQRSLVVSYGDQFSPYHDADLYKGSEAYSLLLEVICGLKSSVIAETEIVKQFKNSYRSYMDGKNRNSDLMRILERVFKDAKSIRANHLMTVGGRSYASLCKKIIKQNSSVSNILVIGSGELAKDVIKQCGKDYQIIISARNKEAVDEIVFNSSAKVVPWKDYEKWSQYNCIINTVGAQLTLFDASFFKDWKCHFPLNSLFVDLGSPSTILTHYGVEDNIFRLTDILSSAKECEIHNQKFVSHALSAVLSLSHYRMEYFQNIARRSKTSISGEQKWQNSK